MPPAPSIFSLAEALKAWALTVSLAEMSPLPSTLTGCFRVARPFSRRLSGVTSSPALKRFSSSETLTGWVRVRKFSNGIDILLLGPRSLPIRMWIGFWPPS